VIVCTERKCCIKSYIDPTSKERIIRLGESASNFFFNENYSFIGVADFSKNSVGFYHLSEYAWPNFDGKNKELNSYNAAIADAK
jgi:hypothetical protein